MQPSRETCLELVRRHGSFTLAYSAAVQPGICRFGDERGFIAFTTVGATALVLADPVAAPEEKAGLIDRFREAHKNVCFWQVTRPVAALLSTRGFLINEMGTETRLDLESYDFAGKEKRNLRLAANRMKKRGYTIREGRMADVDRAELKTISDAWRRTRTVKDREVVFLNRPFSPDDEADVRRFFAHDPDGRLVAFGLFDPVYADGEVVGYSTSFKRRLPDSDIKVGQAVTCAAIETFKQEGRKLLFLGLSPLAGIADKDFDYNRVVSFFFRFGYGNPLFNKYVYNLKGHAQHKREFRGVTEQTYYASDRRLALPRLIKLMRACKVI